MKNLILITTLALVTTNAVADSMYLAVVDVDSVYSTRYVNVPVQVEEQQCVNLSQNNSYDNSNWGGRQSDGLLEKGVDGLFGSTGGLVGIAAGVAIVDEFGGNKNAKVIAGLLGNKIGNDISNKKQQQRAQSGMRCDMVTRTKYERHEEQVLSHYLIKVTDGTNSFNVKRNHSADIGSSIRVNVSVW
mgnify:FL=1